VGKLGVGSGKLGVGVGGTNKSKAQAVAQSYPLGQVIFGNFVFRDLRGSL